MDNQMPWYRRCVRWGQINLVETDPKHCDIEFWREYWRKSEFQGIIVNAGGLIAYYPTSLELQYRAKDLGNRDLFGEFVAAAKEDGLAVLARMDTNMTFKHIYDVHPDWFVVSPEGKPNKVGDRYTACINGPYHREFLPQIIDEIVSNYHVNGFADNNWVSSTRSSGIICQCQNCKKTFTEDYGLELPTKVDWNDKNYKVWIKWNYEIRNRFWDFLNQTTKEKGGPDCLYTGMVHVDIYEAPQLFHDLKSLGERSEFLLLDHQCRLGHDRDGFDANSLAGNLIHEVAGWHKVLAECMGTYVAGVRRFRQTSNPPVETRLWMIEGISGGVSPWAHHVGTTHEDRRQFNVIPSIMKWHKKNEEYLYNREPMANVGLVWSGDNIDFYGRDDAYEKFLIPWNGFKRALTRRRIPFIPVHADNINKEAPNLKVLILPDLAAMSDDQCAAVIRFVRAGGSLIFTGATATLDQWGNKRKEYPLEAITGIKQLDNPDDMVAGTIDAFVTINSHNYMRLPSNRHPIFKGFEDTDLLAFGGSFHKISADGKLKPIATYIPPFPYYPPETSWMRATHTDIPIILAGEHPSGGRILYFAGDIDRCYGRASLPDHGDLLANAIYWAADDDVPLKVEGPGYLDCKLYRQEGRLILHLVNLSGYNLYQGYAEEYLPVGPISVFFKANGFTPGCVYMKVSDREINYKMDGSWLKIDIETLVDHELIVLE